jgi:hypothetical protein
MSNTLKLVLRCGQYAAQSPDSLTRQLSHQFERRQKLAIHYTAYLNSDHVEQSVVENYERQIREANGIIARIAGVESLETEKA